jgi:hypothetical protein
VGEPVIIRNSMKWKFNKADVRRYRDQYCPFRCSVVEKGTWADLWKQGRSTAVSLLPVLGVLGWGYAEGRVRRCKLAKLAGIPEPQVGRGLALLHAERLIEYDTRARMISFSLSRDRTLREDDHARYSFRFGGWGVFAGTWALMLPAQRAIYFALLSQLRYGQSGFYGLEDWFESENELRSRISDADGRSLGDLDVVQEAMGSGCYLSRCVSISLSRVSELSGIARMSVTRSVDDVAKLGRLAPFYRFQIDGGTVFHLPIRAPRRINPHMLHGAGGLRSLRAKQEFVRREMQGR